MREKLVIHELTSAIELFQITDKCTKAKEAHLFVHTEDSPLGASSNKARLTNHERMESTTFASGPRQKLHHEGSASTLPIGKDPTERLRASPRKTCPPDVAPVWWPIYKLQRLYPSMRTDGSARMKPLARKP
jgi:hypothetical protein